LIKGGMGQIYFKITTAVHSEKILAVFLLLAGEMILR
jgi:hypothetical protein